LGTRYLQENQKLLYRQTVKAPKEFNSSSIPDLYVKKVNRRLLGLPINSLVWMHHEGEKRYDKQKFIEKKILAEEKFDRKIAATSSQKKITSLQYRKQRKSDALTGKIENGNNPMQWGEPAAIFDSATIIATQEKIQSYLFKKGYFKSSVTFQTTEYKKRVSVTYLITPSKPYYYDTIFYLIPDPQVLSLIQNNSGSSQIQQQDKYDEDKLNKERERIDLMMKDLGYYDFARQYISFSVDTSYNGKRGIALQIEIKNPARKNSHHVYELDSIVFTTDAAINSKERIKRKTVSYRDITFNYFESQYSKKILAQRVFIHRDSLYSRTSTIATQRQLANLDIFKFININYDTAGGKFTANIFSSPLDRYAWSNEAGVTVTQGFPGPYFSTNFKKRNVFKGLEIIEINGRFGFEGVASATRIGNFYRSTEAGVNGSITFPQFLFPFKEERAFELGKYNPRTRLLAGYSYTDRPEYQRSITTLSNTYTWENKQTTQYSFTLINLNIIRSTLSNQFDSLLTELQQSQGNNLRNSFKPSFVSSVIFGVTWNPNNYGNTERSSYFVRAQAETGGTLFNLAQPNYITARGLELYKYVRFSLDARKSKVINKNTVLAYRINTGIGYSYNTNKVLPYEKYFFAGGSNSVRAWRPRRLGVGTLPPDLANDADKDGLFDYRFEKPGDILLEGSIELRKKLFGFVNGAVFVDAGNVWSFREVQLSSESANKPYWTGSSRFDKNFFKQLGIGTGFGLRFDFSFLVLRFDIGLKVYDPGREEGDRFVLNRVRFFNPYGTNREPVIYNVGIGYPF
jgi:outer membrane protein assembly factor BamA